MEFKYTKPQRVLQLFFKHSIWWEHTQVKGHIMHSMWKVIANTTAEHTALPDYIIYYMATMKMQSFPSGSPSALKSQPATAVSFIPVLWPAGCPEECLKRQKYKSTASDARIHKAGHFAE